MENNFSQYRGEYIKRGKTEKIEKYVESDIFIVTYGDGLANVNINDLVSFHKSHGKIATLTGVLPPSRFGNLSVDGNVIKEFVEKPQTSGQYVNGGFSFLIERYLIISHVMTLAILKWEFLITLLKKVN